VKTFVTLATAGLCMLASAAALAQADHSHHIAQARATAPAAMTAGVIRKVDAAQGTVTIAHEDIKNLSMPKMTMTFKARDPAWLKKMKEGDAIRFVAENQKGELVVTAYESVK
jgi:Cu(I)/Ag(I) efflux system periplasmic protein CusF